MSRVIVVDDNQQNSYLLDVLLRGHGFEVDIASNGVEALKLARTNCPNLIISDILMPTMDGFALCREWMRDKTLREVPFVFYTATYTDPKDRQFALELGAAEFIIKPTEPDEFLQIIQGLQRNIKISPQNVAPENTEDDAIYFKGYNEALVRKLEDKMLQLANANRRLLGLQEACAAMTNSLGLDDVLGCIGGGAIDALNSSAVWLLIINQDNNTLDGKVMVAAKDSDVSAIEEAIGKSFAEIQIPLVSGRNLLIDVALTGQPIFISDVQAMNEFQPSVMSIHIDHISGFEALIVMPLIFNTKVVGVMALAWPQTGGVPTDELQMITAFSHQAAIAIENARLYEEQQQYATHLEADVSARTAELAVALEQAQAADRLKSQFVSDMNHQLRTPLMNIQLYLTLLEQGRSEKRAQYMNTIKRETERLQQLIETILDISALDSGKTASNLENTDLNALVSLLITDRKRLATGKLLTLDLDATANLPMVLADPQMLFQVLTNLFSNALHYTPIGGTVTIHTGTTTAQGEDWVIFQITDTGMGISQEDQAHIFERFYRGKAARENDVPGTGLGLAICKEIVAQHAGWITVESAEGQGSTFTVGLRKAD